MTKRRARLPKGADPIAVAIGDLAVEVITNLADEWPTHRGYDDLRGAVIYAFYEVLAHHQGLVAVPIELVEPRLNLSTAALLMRRRIAEGLPLDDVTPEHFGSVHEVLTGYQLVDGKVAPGEGRRRGGVHFTPRSLTEKVVGRALEPLLKAMEADEKLLSAERLLSLRICDPSVGAGAFLLELVRELGQLVLEAGGARDIHEAKRLVAIHVARGVDKCSFAVYTAKLALRLECRADLMPASWLDDNIKVGDALVGLDRDQVIRFNWRAERSAPIPWLEELFDDAVTKAVKARELPSAHLSLLARAQPDNDNGVAPSEVP
jgi:hypothetical protein